MGDADSKVEEDVSLICTMWKRRVREKANFIAWMVECERMENIQLVLLCAQKFDVGFEY